VKRFSAECGRHAAVGLHAEHAGAAGVHRGVGGGERAEELGEGDLVLVVEVVLAPEEEHLVLQQRRAHLAHDVRVQVAPEADPLDLKPGQLQAEVRERDEVEQDLEERRPAELALGLDLLQQALEGDRLVAVGAENHLLDPPEQLAEGGIARQVGPQHEGVEEQADEPFDLHPAAAGAGRADDHVLLAGEAGEQELEAGEAGHEQRRPLAA